MKKKVGRPAKARKKVGLSLKLDPDLHNDIMDLAAINYSDKTKMIEKCLRIGIPAFIKEDRLEGKLNEYRALKKRQSA